MMESLVIYNWEILFVNDGSSDNTLKTIKELRENDEIVSYVDLSRNFGKESAMLAGLDYVLGDCVVIMDADLQHPPFVINEMLKKWEEGYDDVYAKRLTRGKESYLRKKLSLSYYALLEKSSRMEVLPNVGDFRLLDKRCIQALRTLRETCRYTKGLFCWIGYKKTFVEFEQGDRVAGETKMSYFKLFKLAIEGLISYTTAPLRFSSIIGFIISLLAFVYMVYVVLKTLICGETVDGFPTIICVVLFIGGLNLLCLGIIGEYIARIYNETKMRPVYLVREYNGILK